MKPNTKNFTGHTKMRYRIDQELTELNGGFRMAYFYEVYNPFDKDWHCLDVKTGEGHNREDARELALSRAQKAWGLDLVKNEPAFKTA